MFSKFAEEKVFMLECNISYIAYFDSDYMSIANYAPQKVIQIVFYRPDLNAKGEDRPRIEF